MQAIILRLMCLLFHSRRRRRRSKGLPLNRVRSPSQSHSQKLWWHRSQLCQFTLSSLRSRRVLRPADSNTCLRRMLPHSHHRCNTVLTVPCRLNCEWLVLAYKPPGRIARSPLSQGELQCDCQTVSVVPLQWECILTSLCYCNSQETKLDQERKVFESPGQPEKAPADSQHPWAQQFQGQPQLSQLHAMGAHAGGRPQEPDHVALQQQQQQQLLSQFQALGMEARPLGHNQFPGQPGNLFNVPQTQQEDFPSIVGFGQQQQQQQPGPHEQQQQRLHAQVNKSSVSLGHSVMPTALVCSEIFHDDQNHVFPKRKSDVFHAMQWCLPIRSIMHMYVSQKCLYLCRTLSSYRGLSRAGRY